MKPPPARSLTSVWLIGVPSNWKSLRSLASGNLAMVSWYLIERADLGVEQITDDALGLMLAFDCSGHDLVEGSLHAVELELAHEVEELSAFHQMVLLRLSYRAQSATGAWRSVSAAGVRIVAGGQGSRWRARMLRTTSAERTLCA